MQNRSSSSFMLGESTALRAIQDLIEKVAPTSATVLIQGESGTGKELVARSLHLKSLRSDQPFISVNCGALNENLLESELFGHEKGAFTGALNQKMGLAEAANGGTLLLDEVGEMSFGLQAKLLRFLQEGEFYRVGGKKPIQVDVRIISATNRELETEIKNGRFREDLFYRLNTITLRTPPLRDRREDIPLLVEHFLTNSRHSPAGGPAKILDARALDALQKYDWPGNIRELQNTMERLRILVDGPRVQFDDLPPQIRMPVTRRDLLELSPTTPLEEVEKRHILRTLTFFQGNKTRCAQSLGITVKTLYNKLRCYGMGAA
mgnify:CR=1 FL=1